MDQALKIIGHIVLGLIGINVLFGSVATILIIRDALRIKKNRAEVLAAWQELANTRYKGNQGASHD